MNNNKKTGTKYQQAQSHRLLLNRCG